MRRTVEVLSFLPLWGAPHTWWGPCSVETNLFAKVKLRVHPLHSNLGKFFLNLWYTVILMHMCGRAQVTFMFTVWWSEEEKSPRAVEMRTMQLCQTVVLGYLVCFVKAFYLAPCLKSSALSVLLPASPEQVLQMEGRLQAHTEAQDVPLL